MRHFLEVDDLSKDELLTVLDLAEIENPDRVLTNQSVGLVFEKASLRTRNSCETAVFQLGGHPVSIAAGEVGIDRRESAEDVARTLACYHSFIGARVFDHSVLVRMARAVDDTGAKARIINLLSDSSHPCQALADLLTIRSHVGFAADIKVAYVGDSNNVTRSLAIGALMVGLKVKVASPRGYWFDQGERDHLASLGEISFVEDPYEAAAGADVVYTDVWTSMGQEDERDRRLRDFQGYTVDSSLMAKAHKRAIVMHCLPAHEGEEISREVLESPASVVWEQAKNRMKAMRGLFQFMSGVG